MPECFSDYGNTRIILDCTEIKRDVPASLEEQNQTWSLSNMTIHLKHW